MKITVHRGTDQIGGCVTEYEHNGWKLFVDYGEQLPGAPVSDLPLEIDGLTCGDLRKSALLITHYHGDHIGKIAELPMQLPIFMGKIAKEIASELANHLSRVSNSHKKLAERLNSVNTFKPGEEFSIGEFKIMPVVIDHSAFDAYAFRIEAERLKVFHSGDFRTHGFRSSKLPKVIEKFVGRVNYVVCEATNVNRPNATNVSENELQKQFEEAFKNSKYNVVYVSSTNIDRLFGLYHAALRAHLPFYVDDYQKKIMDIVAGRDAIWGKSKLYKYVEGREPIVLQREDADFRINDKFKELLAENGYVLIARSGERFDNLISQMHNNDRMTFLSQWNGYLDESKAAYNSALAKSVGTDYQYLHTSGHCDMQSLANLFELLKPSAIIPIHTDNPNAFANLFSDQWPIIMLNDGDSFSAIVDPGFDTTIARVFAYKQHDKSYQDIDNPENLPWFIFDDKSLGEFPCWKDAESALRHVIYSPNQLIGYSIEADEDMAPEVYVVYDSKFTEYSEYNEGGHDPNGNCYQQKTDFTSGERVWAIIDNEILVPCIFVGPVSEEYYRNLQRKMGAANEKIIDEYISELWDWDWDKVIVRPLVKIKTENHDRDFGMDFQTVFGSETEVQRIYVFPFDYLSKK